ncbi:MAG: cobalt-precorrin-5B (C(1))-methyltransferase [Chloroflexi bacterium]|nr:cobalt-precorrin-5B (C(1))-methyltransferase [Chloroflexota bacterium]
MAIIAEETCQPCIVSKAEEMTVRRKKGKLLRHGYTTGACAAAAARAATMALLWQKIVEQVEIDLPHSGKANFRVEKCVFNSLVASCSIIKDAGDDPDVTNGAEICATVSWKTEPGIAIDGGEGVGLVTKPGLEISVGLPAINPVPRQIITSSVREVVAGSKVNGRGIQVTISVPQGNNLAKRTLNPRLGIKGGLSILGTTGIVIPYSVDAYTASISQALDVAVACGCRDVVLTTGRRSEKFAQSELTSLAEECFIQSGDFVGYSLQECAKRGVTRVVIWGMVGKISKLAAGHLYTNVSDSRVNIDFLAGMAASCGVPEERVKALREAVTANQFRRMLSTAYTKQFCDRLCLLAAKKCREYAGRKLEVECIMTDYEGTILGRANVSK